MTLLIAMSLCMSGALAAEPATPRIAVYQSEENHKEYAGVYQEPLRTWLGSRGLEFEVIGDAQAARPDGLARFAAVMASSAYIVPDAAADGLARYVEQGGGLLWIDGPARVRHPGLRQALGLEPGISYGQLGAATLQAVDPEHPLCLSLPRAKAGFVVGNYVPKIRPDASVVYDVTGSVDGETEATRPGVILMNHGRGVGICCNWVVWQSAPPVTGALLANCVEYLMARHELMTLPLSCALHPATLPVRQPQPLSVVVKLFAKPERKGETAQVSLRFVSAEGGPEVSERVCEVAFEAADDALAAGSVTVPFEIEGRPDGEYTVTCEVAMGETRAECRPLTVHLQGEQFARLKVQEAQRRKLLEPTLLGTLGDYDAEPRKASGRVDIPRLIEQIETANMNMYDWLIWHRATDWEDLQEFLPEARKRGIKVWVTVCPPSEQGGAFPHSEPFRLDFIRWADEIGKLSVEYDNLVAFVIDDFWSGPNRALYTADYIERMVEALRAHNPKLAFLPTLYWTTVGNAQWLEDFGAAIDGIVFPYAELQTGDDLQRQLQACRDWLGPEKFLMMNLYAAGSAGNVEPGPRTEEYMRKVLETSREMCDGIRIYCLPKGDLLEDHRYRVTAELYGKWQGEQAASEQ